MIDVVFLLLIFFMLAARLDQPQALALKTGGLGSDWTGPPRLIDVYPDGLALNGQSLTVEAMSDALSRLVASSDDPVVMRGRNGVDLQRLVDVMLELEQAGFRNLMLAEPQ